MLSGCFVFLPPSLHVTPKVGPAFTSEVWHGGSDLPCERPVNVAGGTWFVFGDSFCTTGHPPCYWLKGSHVAGVLMCECSMLDNFAALHTCIIQSFKWCVWLNDALWSVNRVLARSPSLKPRPVVFLQFSWPDFGRESSISIDIHWHPWTSSDYAGVWRQAKDGGKKQKAQRQFWKHSCELLCLARAGTNLVFYNT